MRTNFELLPKSSDEVVDGTGGPERVISPDLVEQVIPFDDLALVDNEIAQNLELERGQVDFVAASPHALASEVDVNLAKSMHAAVSGIPRRIITCSRASTSWMLKGLVT